ncbi:hypothetical protein E4T44_04587 [Aureobasidium sp. EXF-8845]|nr:hypothetical protein E4T44_04587 [Aureobasidium sp. EXF-8845]KAI4851176.1 hypothetical protein E4T45_05194 [Aureobasidium sp. EXF-8846]
MSNPPDPQSNTWTAEVLSTLLTTPTKRLTCKCTDDFTIHIPESLLCYFSRYYAALLRGSFVEAGSNTTTLELKAAQAKAFVTWMHSGRFAEDCDYKMLFELYVFADKVDVPAMKKDIMTFIHKRSHRRGSPEMKDTVRTFHLLPKSCGLVRWMLDRFAHHEGFDLTMDQEFGISVLAARNMGHELTCRNTTMSVDADPCCNVVVKLGCNCSERCQEKATKGQACAYHEHASPEEWKSCAGDGFKGLVDLAYLKGITVHDPVPEERWADY